MRDVESVSCDVVNNTVYISDQNGNMVNILSIPGLENAYSTGRCIIAETETMSYTYKVRRDGSLEPPGIRGRVRAPDPPSDDLIPKVSDSTEQVRGSSRDHAPSRSYGGGSNGSPGCWFAFIIFAILYCLIYQKGCSHNDGDRPPPAVKKEYKGREYIRECITGWDSCRLVAITKNGGNVAVAGKNSCAVCGAYPNKLWDALKEISNDGHRITDVCLTDKGKWVVLFGTNGYRSEGLPKDMCDRLAEFHDDHETLLSVTINDKGEWVVISDKHFSSSSTEIQNWLNEGMAEYGNPLSVSITDDAGVAIFEKGRIWRGKYPKDLREAAKKSPFVPCIIRMAGTSWFFADETGAHYHYHM